MEIALMQKSMLRLKGKHATFVVNPQDETDANAAFFLDDTLPSVKTANTVMIHGAGDYEIGGVKITGTRGEKGILYSLNIDGVDLIVGRIDQLAAMQHKIKEHSIVIALSNEVANASFLTSLASSVVVVYGDKAGETVKGFEKEIAQVTKYTATAGKLPTEIETVLLA
jgi:hypothetical protein